MEKMNDECELGEERRLILEAEEANADRPEEGPMTDAELEDFRQACRDYGAFPELG